MRRVKVEGADQPPSKHPKRKMGRPAGVQADEDLTGPKPGVESRYPHMAQQFIGKDGDMVEELTHMLRPSAALALGIRRRSGQR